MHNPAPVIENDTHELLCGLISARRPGLIIINKKKTTCKIVSFAVPADHCIKLKEYEKKDKYLDLARELKKKKLWNMKVAIIPIIIDAFGTVTKGLLKGLEDLEVGGRVDTIQTTTLVRTARILRRVLGTWWGLLSLKLLWKFFSLNWCKKTLNEWIIIIIIIITDKNLQKQLKVIKQKKNTEINRNRKEKTTQERLTFQLEEIYQKVLAKEGRLQRYRQRVKQYRQNRTFQNNERKLYRQLERDDYKS